MSTRPVFSTILRSGLVSTSCLASANSFIGKKEDFATRCDGSLSANSSLVSEKLDMALETNRFNVALARHRSRLLFYKNSWDYDKVSSRIPTVSWPTEVASREEISALKDEIRYCDRSPNFRDDTSYCDSVKFRIASALLKLEDDCKASATGLHIMKDLAERGNADGMCMYGTCLNDGMGGLEPNPKQAVVWWRRCAELYDHTHAMYELGVAFYTGEGVVEDEIEAAKFFRRAADLGHPGASYMYGDCLLEGIGVEKDRAKALERLIEAAERGHRGARSRVIAVLEMRDDEDFGIFTDSSRQSLVASDDKDCVKKQRANRSERRFTMGGSSQAVLAKRRTIVEDSRRI